MGRAGGSATVLDAGALDGARLLDAWDEVSRLARPWAELRVLAAATELSLDELARLPIGRRDRLLLDLHERLLGPRIDCETDCPACGERLELEADVDDLRIDGDDPAPGDAPSVADTAQAAEVRAAGSGVSEPAGVLPARSTVHVDGWEVALRPADSLDLAAALESPDAAAELLERCVVSARQGGAVGPRPLPEGLLAALDERLAALDPAADLELDLVCPACGERWHEAVDPATFVLHDIEARALRLLEEVDALARAYGWREPDVLALSDARRCRYLELALS